MKRLVIAGLSLLSAVALSAQQPPAAGGQGRGRGPATAPPGINWPSPPLPDGPISIETALVRPVKITVTKGLNQPWSMVFLPDGTILVTERGGKLRRIRDGRLDPNPVEGVPAVAAQGLAGLMDIQLHPKFAQNHYVYLTYHKPAAGAAAAAPPANGRGNGGPQPTLTLARATWDGNKLVDLKEIFSGPQAGSPSRILFGRDGSLFMSIGSGDPTPDEYRANDVSIMLKKPAQDPMSLQGKTLRLKDDGSVPKDNPFSGKSGYRSEIYTLGHRNILGLTMNPETGAIWSVENGPNGGDEVNELLPGHNYGWPVVNNGRFYLGPRVSVNPYREGMDPPVAYWVPAIAPSGLLFYTGDKFPQWKNNLFIGGMRQGEVPRSGHLERMDFNDKWEELHREGMFRELQNRIRDVRQSPDGYIYLLTAENDGALLKLEPGTK
ncbi:MAG TPA: PQQ-dependent sugar dehydrogenase [Vicinamibacterales bacterium]|nr:PQQ-dependent sugar dehydrogenase [Vicinamibacterales bacterium]